MSISTSDAIRKIKALLADALEANERPQVTNHARRGITSDVLDVKRQLDELLRELDPIKQPDTVFDPSEPTVVGRFVALALVAQTRSPLQEFDRFYGSGVYALYYHGQFNEYLSISGAETPIYVGKADPAVGTARTPQDQGDRLSRRLLDHRRSIENASNLNIDDFSYRSLVVQSGWQEAAEAYLIHFFKPIWNSETGILYGLGKHGDSSSTRANKRSPWDTLHPGRAWAGDSKIADARSVDEIIAGIVKHFAETHVHTDINSLFDAFIGELRQIN